ncbi:AzlC family ABC transporter permease [Brevibacillus agri]|uniref:AzlC family ABC transporter permease n=1 Tax=Brevibacillus agri TaxID=51101 RepID=UPI0018CED520|nr:AzlC family ABC transporter permease [Brevibacillus agri]MBG9568221.1 AzlC family protein [Brevibacillus agri]
MKLSKHSASLFWQGAWDALPLAASYILSAIIFGMMALAAGLTVWESVAMSLFIYTGAAQFSAVGMIAEHTGMWAILLTTFLLNTRHFLMGLSVSPYYQGLPLAHVNVLAFFMTDEQYAVSLNRFRHHQSEAAYLYGVSLTLHACWVLGTWAGSLAGEWIPDPGALGLGFSYIAMFIALSYFQLTSLSRILTFLLCGGLAVGVALLLPNGLHLLVAGLVAFCIGFALPAKEKAASSPQAESAQGVETA